MTTGQDLHHLARVNWADLREDGGSRTEVAKQVTLPSKSKELAHPVGFIWRDETPLCKWYLFM